MTLTDALTLSHVPRWTIVPTLRQQNVADHTYRVMVIFVELCGRLTLTYGTTDLLNILYHDIEESRTGDIPTPAKRKLGISGEEMSWGSPRLETAFSIADTLEAYTYIERYGVGHHYRRVAEEMLRGLRIMCPADWWITVVAVMDDITFENGR